MKNLYRFMGEKEKHTNEFITDKTRSMPERLFERYCETRADKIEWVYKNGDTGQQYLSIILNIMRICPMIVVDHLAICFNFQRRMVVI